MEDIGNGLNHLSDIPVYDEEPEEIYEGESFLY